MTEIKSIDIKVTYVTNTYHGSNDFKNLHEFKIWLDKHPDLALALGYTKGKKITPSGARMFRQYALSCRPNL